MRFYTKTHQHYCGIDLHAKTMYLCILDSEGTVLFHRNIPCEPEKFLRAIAPYRADLVVAVMLKRKRAFDLERFLKA